jgi:hypothetical protein
MNVMARLGNWLRLAAMLGATALLAAHTPSAAAGTNKPEPKIAQAKGDHCIKDDAFMIRHHPDLLKHQRNDTLRKGIRAGEFSLKRCMECHAGEGDGHAAKTDCDTCHAYPAVKLDCWDCHAKKPGKPKTLLPAQASQPLPMTTSVQSGGQPQ